MLPGKTVGVTSMKSPHLETALASLKDARSKLRNAADVRVTEELDNAIALIEEELRRPTGERANVAVRALAHLEQAIRLVPMIERLLEELGK